MGLAALGKGLKRNLPFIAEHLPDVPELAYRALSNLASGQIEYRLSDQQLQEIKNEIRHSGGRTRRVIAGSALVLSGVLILALDGIAPLMVGDGALFFPLTSALLLVPGLYLLWVTD